MKEKGGSTYLWTSTFGDSTTDTMKMFDCLGSFPSRRSSF